MLGFTSCGAWWIGTRSWPICSNSSHASVPVASWRSAWSIRTAISSPGWVVPSARCERISLWVSVSPTDDPRLGGRPSCAMKVDAVRPRGVVKLTLNKVDSAPHRVELRWAPLSSLSRFVAPRRPSTAKYFVTGATGFIGGRVTRQLVEAGHEGVPLGRNPENAPDLSSIGVDVRPGDVTNQDSLPEPMAGAAGVFHIAGLYKIRSQGP